MTIAQKFLFTTRFDRAAPPPRPVSDVVEPPPPPPPPMFSEAELEAAKQQAFDAGRQDGLAEAWGAAERQAAAALSAIAQRLQAMAQHQAEADGINGRNAVRAAMAAARKVLPAMARRHALEEIEALFGECVAHFVEEPRVTVRVQSALVEAVRDKLTAAVEDIGFQGTLTVSSDDRLGPGDCRVDWGNGGAERSQDRLWAAIEGIVERTLASPERSDDPLGEAGV